MVITTCIYKVESKIDERRMVGIMSKQNKFNTSVYVNYKMNHFYLIKCSVYLLSKIY